MRNDNPPDLQSSPRLKGNVQLQKVGKVYQSGDKYEVILRDCTFDIPPGKLTVLIGPSGCGKSTLIKLVAGYDNPTAGAILMDQQPINSIGPDRTVVFQETALFPWMSLQDNVMFGPIQQGMDRAQAHEQAHKLLTKVGLAGFETKFPDQVSGGMQRRAEVARALINNPKLMMLDEPFRGLDHMSRGLMQEYFSTLFEETGMTTLFVTSEVDEAIFLADRIVVLSYKPTCVKEIVDVPLPRPRQFSMLTTPVYARLKEHILGLLYEEALKGFAAGAIGAKEIEQLTSAVQG
ncbi:ABC transporter ATP-binding protein [Lacisediminimonas sp.]|uniref:ABC transporter ATP-binding protein n=1 Tax=Lacisediminimonas sp. TaxID=3060582 RepID=UPI00271EC698|nr:ABC transporter ATP-binding protein [Lacisediminimonas sp.]MDO8300290.1 ABC transporter ATP-binding protein [Lacisediminimonas sp.]